MRTILLTICLLLIAATSGRAEGLRVDPKDWSKLDDKHFVVWYGNKDGTEDARAILRKAEEYYDRITDNIGYNRFQSFWTWDQRVVIVYFSDADKYRKVSGQPAWSKGFSVSHLSSFNLRMIVSFKGQENFMDTILPHEISHLVLHDFMGAKPKVKLPAWFDEGVAQLEEKRDDDDEHRAIMAALAAQKRTVPFEDLNTFPLKGNDDGDRVAIFYAESLYIVDFLIKTYGRDAFRELCRLMRDGREFNDALQVAYYPNVESMSALENKWLNYMSQK